MKQNLFFSPRHRPRILSTIRPTRQGPPWRHHVPVHGAGLLHAASRNEDCSRWGQWPDQAARTPTQAQDPGQSPDRGSSPRPTMEASRTEEEVAPPRWAEGLPSPDAAGGLWVMLSSERISLPGRAQRGPRSGGLLLCFQLGRGQDGSVTRPQAASAALVSRACLCPVAPGGGLVRHSHTQSLRRACRGLRSPADPPPRAGEPARPAGRRVHQSPKAWGPVHSVWVWNEVVFINHFLGSREAGGSCKIKNQNTGRTRKASGASGSRTEG